MQRVNQKEIVVIFFFNDTATTEIYTLSLHDALPISSGSSLRVLAIASPFQQHQLDADPGAEADQQARRPGFGLSGRRDRKSTRLNSSHSQISYAVFCLKKKKK